MLVKGKVKGKMQTHTEPRPDQCESCHGSLSPIRPWQRFCSARCRNRWHAEERRQALAAYRSNERPARAAQVGSECALPVTDHSCLRSTCEPQC